MILAITEINHWEHERWNYLLDADKQGADVLNDLFSFIKLCNTETDAMSKAAYDDPKMPWVTDMWGRQLYKLFAASNYRTYFYDRIEWDEKYEYPILITGRHKMHMNGHPSYRDNMYDLERRISPARMYSAMIAMRDRKENKLYKDFESLFLKQKTSREPVTTLAPAS